MKLPKTFYTSDKEGVIIFENLRDSGFVPPEKSAEGWYDTKLN